MELRCRNRRPIRWSRARGVTLVEVMVGAAAGLLLLSALAALFANNSAARGEIDRVSQQVENGRFALELLRDDVHMAGYYGGLSTESMQPSAACVPRTGVGVTDATLGWNAASATTPLAIHGYASGDVPPDETCFTHQKAGTDVLVLRSVETQAVAVGTAASDSNETDTFLQISSCNDPLVDPPDRPFVLAAGGPGAATRFVLRDGDCTTAAPVRKLLVHAYYVGKCSVCSGSGDGIPALRVVELAGSTATNSSLVEGIETMRVEYALDRDRDGVTEAIVRCQTGTDSCTASDWQNVIGVQIYLLARSAAPSPGHLDRKVYDMGLAGTLPAYGDAYKRRRFSAMVTAYNRAGSRER